MRVFLSHSSADKGYVDSVVSELRPGTYELDSETFDKGLFNAQAIVTALNRCSMFCLFLSQNAAKSSFVTFERSLSLELVASGKLQRVLVICLDDASFDLASKNERLFNIVRKVTDEASTARLIIGHLETIAVLAKRLSRPFFGRENEMSALEDQLDDHTRPQARAIYISGNIGSGRRSFAAQFYQRRFPSAGRNFPQVKIGEFAGLWELYRSVLTALRPNMRIHELRTRDASFEIASDDNKALMIAQHLNSLLQSNEASTFIDGGGLHDNEGRLVPEIDSILNLLDTRPHPPVIFISNRRINLRYRRLQQDVAYAALESLPRETSVKLMSALLKDNDFVVSAGELEELVELSDGHPFNFYRILEEIKERSLSGFLSNPSRFNEWKHRRTSEYLSELEFSPVQSAILALLTHVPQLDFVSIVEALGLEAYEVSDAISVLLTSHVVEEYQNLISISPALRIAVSKDRRISLPEDKRSQAIAYLTKSLSIRIEDGTAPVSLIESAIVAVLANGSVDSAIAAAFMLPSHHLWIAKRKYDQGIWAEALRLSKKALENRSRLSEQGLVAACRYMCLSASRLGTSEDFDRGLGLLQARAAGQWARSNVSFLKGFQARLNGSLPQAEELQREAYMLSNGNFSAARELSAICLVRQNLEDAERFAREAYEVASRNEYVLDVLAAVLINKGAQGSNSVRDEIEEILGHLERLGADSGRSFYKTRSAHYEHLLGENRKALSLIEEAIHQTPHIFEPRRLHAEILLKDGNNSKAHDVIKTMADMVYSKTSGSRKQNFREYLEVKAKYLSQIGDFAGAKSTYDDDRVFTLEERAVAIKRIEMDQSFRYQARR